MFGAAAQEVFDRSGVIALAGEELIADPSGALYWPAHALLAVADLHFEKGSSFARRGVLLPPYDTAATLSRLAQVIAHYSPRIVLALGDSFHDGDGPSRLTDKDRATLRMLQRGRDWIWIAGNHDPDPAIGIGGSFASLMPVGNIVFRHEPTPRSKPDAAEIAGHLHPMARVSMRGRALSRKCFASDEMRMVLPAFGAYTGGLNVRDRAFASLFGTLAFTAHMLGTSRLFAIDAARCLPD